MATDRARQTRRATERPMRTALVSVAVVASLVVVPALVVVDIEFGLLTALGLGGDLAFGLLVMIPGFALGGLALVVMLGS